MLWLKHHFSDITALFLKFLIYLKNIPIKINYCYIFLYIKEESSNSQKASPEVNMFHIPLVKSLKELTLFPNS